MKEVNAHQWPQDELWHDRVCQSWRWTSQRSCKDDLEYKVEYRNGYNNMKSTLDNNVTVLAKGRTLHGKGQGST